MLWWGLGYAAAAAVVFGWLCGVLKDPNSIAVGILVMAIAWPLTLLACVGVYFAREDWS
jgi:ABC-type uncharacterized transport system permease subunit